MEIIFRSILTKYNIINLVSFKIFVKEVIKCNIANCDI